jgi:hypothetical protein
MQKESFKSQHAKTRREFVKSYEDSIRILQAPRITAVHKKQCVDDKEAASGVLVHGMYQVKGVSNARVDDSGLKNTL